MGLGQTLATGVLRFTAPASFAQLYIAPLLPDLLSLHPGVTLGLRLSDKSSDLIEGNFDLALRNSTRSDSSLKARKLAEDHRVLCAAPEYLARYGVPESPEDPDKHHLIALGDRMTRHMIGPNCLEALFETPANTCRLMLDDGLTQRAVTRSGARISALGRNPSTKKTT